MALTAESRKIKIFTEYLSFSKKTVRVKSVNAAKSISNIFNVFPSLIFLHYLPIEDAMSLPAKSPDLVSK